MAFNNVDPISSNNANYSLYDTIFMEHIFETVFFLFRYLFSAFCMHFVPKMHIRSFVFVNVCRKVYSHTKVSTCVQGSPHLGQRSWFPPWPDPPEPDSLFPSLMLFCVNMRVSVNTELHYYHLFHVQSGVSYYHGREV